MTSPATAFPAPFATRLASANRILIAGAGGGFDVFAGLPLYFALRGLGRTAFLANLTFTYMGGTDAEFVGPALWRVDHRSSGEKKYFPEKYLGEWLHANELPSEVYCFDKVGLTPLRAAYDELVGRLRVDTVILVDGGTDIIMRGDETSLGSPAEDITSLAAVARLDIPGKLVSCLGFGIDARHGVCHGQFLENVAALDQQGGYLGAHSLHLGAADVEAYRSAVEYVHGCMPERRSFVSDNVLSALEGQFGDFHRSSRTDTSQLFISPLMSMYWHFDLGAVARRCLYIDRLEGTHSIFDVQRRIDEFRSSTTPRPRLAIPY